MILTVTPNPSLDLLFTADRLVRDDANRVPMPRRRAGGQGINLVRAARALAPDVEAVAIMPIGGPAGRELTQMLEAEGVPVRSLAITGDTRVFVSVRERLDGHSILLNPSGPGAEADLGARLLRAVEEELDRREASGWVACCGSLLPGLPTDLYRSVTACARERGARVAVDCDGDALEAVADTADLIVPNAHEAQRLLGRPVTTLEEAVDAAIRLRAAGPEHVAVTLGAGGAVLASEEGTWVARPELPAELVAEVEEGSPVGAGDAFLGALLIALGSGAPPSSCLKAGVAAGTAVLLSRGGDILRAEDERRVRPHVGVDALPPGK